MPVAVINGARVHYVQLGGASEDQEDLVMVHGLATNLAFWYLPYAIELSARYRVTLYDLRGHGRSETTSAGYRPADLAADLHGLLDHLGIGRAHFLTHSFGGVVALRFACQFPQRIASLVIADTHIAAARGAGTSPAWRDSARIQGILDDAGLALDARDPYFGYQLLTEVARLHVHGAFVPPALAELVAPLRLRRTRFVSYDIDPSGRVAPLGGLGSKTAAQWLELMDRTSARSELMGDDGLGLEELRRLRFPILAMYGDQSQARLTGEELLSVWPHAVFRRVRHAGHFFPTTRAREVIADCTRFWDGEFAETTRQRTGEHSERHFRSDRIYESDSGWFCLTRETDPLGPYPAPDDARRALASHISSMAST